MCGLCGMLDEDLEISLTNTPGEWAIALQALLMGRETRGAAWSEFISTGHS